MRLHRLRVRAFGPFADEVVVDFDALGADGLFLLHGQTGAGKTTVLDAVAFALFGRVPGARDINRRLHSDHAAPEVVPEVELEATIGARRLRIIRSPEHERPKKRGEGTRKINAKATLAWVDGSGPDLTRIPDIGDAVVRLLGMSAEQFFQVVLLPQGDFAKFLRAHSDEREALLERLFDTERFGDLEDWFRSRARESADRLAEHTGALERLASAIGAVSATPPPSEPDIDWAQMCLDAARADLARATTDLSAAQTRAQESQADYEQAGRLAELRRRGEAATKRLAELAAGQPALDTAAHARQLALRAGPIVPLADEHARVTGEVAAFEQAVDRARSRLAALPEGAALCEGDADDEALEAAIACWTEESGRWEPLAARLAGRPAMVAALEELERTVADTDGRIREAREQLASAPERRSAAVAELRAAEDTAATIPVLRAERDDVRRLRRALSERAEVEKAARSAAADLLDAREKHTAAREHLLDIRERRVAGMAVELAARLVDGEPCVVCGSLDHPAPAASESDQPPSEAEEKAAAAVEEKASTARAHAQSVMAAIEARRDDLDALIADADPAAVAADDARLGEALAAAERAATRLAPLRQALDTLDAEVTARRAALADLESAQSGRRERLGNARTELAALDAEVELATGGRVGLEERRRELAELCRRTRESASARGDLRRSRARLADVTERLQAACAEAGFDSADAVRAAAAPDRRIRDWETMLTEAANLRAAAQDTLADTEVRAALDAAAPDLVALEEQCRVASDRRESAAGAHAVARQRVGDLEDLVGQYWAALEDLRPVQERHAELFGLAELVSGRGQNSRRMTLRSYVLAARLDEVLVAASARLRQMSSGRYEFVHSDAVGPRGRRGGLGIEVRDEYTGALRPTTTLSGGETFFASLALALGLADVVSAESGGRVLDTIFIDEGFGTLDPEALDLVMGVLDELREGGRVVGVVSHVDELRARIPAQLHVLRGENGSRIRLQSPLGVS